MTGMACLRFVAVRRGRLAVALVLAVVAVLLAGSPHPEHARAPEVSDAVRAARVLTASRPDSVRAELVTLARRNPCFLIRSAAPGR